MIPEHAAVKYLARAKDMDAIKAVWDMFERCARGAASAVGAEYKVWRNEPANKNMITNQALSDVFNRNYEALGGGHMPHIDSTGSTDMGEMCIRDSHCFLRAGGRPLRLKKDLPEFCEGLKALMEESV